MAQRLAWLAPGDPFPPLTRALKRPNGLLAATETLEVSRLALAYQKGIFPWYSAGEPVLWWSPDPRMVLRVANFTPGSRLQRTVRTNRFDIRHNHDFRAVMQACATIERPGQAGTWITTEVVDAYCALHARGLAHSVESWLDGALVGGLYGVQVGRMFFGESMFARVSDASKVALVHLVQMLRAADMPLIDCQQETAHLASFGASPIPRSQFAAELAPLVAAPAPVLELNK